jgi:tetrahydromethanopterin S-methyltransferase subunit G
MSEVEKFGMVDVLKVSEAYEAGKRMGFNRGCLYGWLLGILTACLLAAI